MKSYHFLLIIAFSIVSACGTAPTASSEAPITTSELNSEVNKSVAKLFVTGMTCKAGCGGKIEKELQALAGIKSTETLFEEQRAENVIQVEFDPASVDAKRMEQCVEQIMDGKYTVQKIEVLNYHGLQSHASSGADVEHIESSYSELFKLLNIFQSLGKLLSTDL